MTPVQCKMARVALDISVRDLAKLAKVSPNTISRFERREELRAATVDAIRASLEKSGILFISDNIFGGPGVRLAR